MKTNILIYLLSIILLICSFILVVEYPNAQRTQLIAGGLAFIGFLLNITGFAMKKG